MTSNDWQAPIDIADYDKRIQLATMESEYIQSLIHAWSIGKRPRITHLQANIPRLVTPILNALDYLKVNNNTPIATLQMILRSMDELQCTYWAWNEQNIAEIVNRDWSVNLPSREFNAKRHLITSAYLLQRPVDFDLIDTFDLMSFAKQIFGEIHFNEQLERVLHALHEMGQTGSYAATTMNVVLAKTWLMNRTPHLETISFDLLDRLYQQTPYASQRAAFYRFSKVLFHLGVHHEIIQPDRRGQHDVDTLAHVPDVWADWCEHWHNTSTLSPRSRRGIYFILLKVGRWLHATCPEQSDPERWTRETVAQYIAEVSQMAVGDWSEQRYLRSDGDALSARSKITYIEGLRTFFMDCQAWGWLPHIFDPRRAFRIPRWILLQAEPNPRTIRDDIWGKLLIAGLNLTDVDLPKITSVRGRDEMVVYPLEMVRAICMVWLFCGLRRDEVLRLQTNCIRWVYEPAENSAYTQAEQRVCLLEVPVNKTGQSFQKPIDAVVGDAIAQWRQMRPETAPMLDRKTNERVEFLFAYRNQRIGKDYINDSLIPMLCRKANIPINDTRGRITSHRARSTIATQLANAPEPMSLAELQQWLGHRTPDATRHYVRITPVRQAKAYLEAAYLKRNLRLIDVLIDIEAVRGQRETDEPWRFYHLGHGYCSYDFFDQCQHRMACARCAFYITKSSTKGQWLAASEHLKRMAQTITLTDAERAAVDDGIEASQRLIAMLTDQPTPDQGRIIEPDDIVGGVTDDD